MKRLLRNTIAFGTLLLCLSGLALAGPPLICHSFDIGDARSLPWNGTAWNLAGNENYDTHNLTRDTLAILDSGAPVLVRMETLRRATLYARKDPVAAKELMTRLYARTGAGGKSEHVGALAYFDAGYLAAAYDQWMKDGVNPATGIDGYGLVKKALAMSGENPQMEFAAALMTMQGPQKEHWEHAQKATAGAKGDPLLARNLARNFLGDKNQTVAQALGRGTGY